MKPLLAINLISLYGSKKYSGIHHTSYLLSYLKNIFINLETTLNPYQFKESILVLSQLYFDALIENPSHSKNFLDVVMLSGKRTISSFYRGNGIDESARELICRNISELYNSIKSTKLKHRHINMDGVIQNFGLNMSSIDVFKNLDTIVCVATSAFEPSYLMMDIIEKDELVPLRYSRVSRHDVEVKNPLPNIESKITSKQILVVEDFMSSGMTLDKIVQYINKLCPKETYISLVSGFNEMILGFDLYCDKKTRFNGFNRVYKQK